MSFFEKAEPGCGTKTGIKDLYAGRSDMMSQVGTYVLSTMCIVFHSVSQRKQNGSGVCDWPCDWSVISLFKDSRWTLPATLFFDDMAIHAERPLHIVDLRILAFLQAVMCAA